jgi:hypothetical protein
MKTQRAWLISKRPIPHIVVQFTFVLDTNYEVFKIP